MDKNRVIDCRANQATSISQGVSSSSKSAEVKVAKAQRDGTKARDRGRGKGSGEGDAERVLEDSRTHQHQVGEELHEDMVVIKWDGP